ncbi:MAG: hypothetical protein SGJ20_00715 [Planctomycetota bacterium]|nr:hypothetical protein [Planctomycetota bacterium]
MNRLILCLAVMVSMICVGSVNAAEKLKALIVDGQNNHDWKATTPVMKKQLEDSELLTVDVATSPIIRPR